MRMPEANKDFEDPPVGTWPARCYRVVDLGTQATKFQEETKFQHKVMLSWELQTETPMADGRRFTVSKRYTFSSHDKGNFRKDLESWRGSKMTDSDFGANGFEINKLLGAPALLSLTASSKDGKNYVNVTGVLRPLKGMPIAPLENEAVFLSLDRHEFSQSTFDKLSDGLKETIKKSPEFAELFRAPPPTATPVTGATSSLTLGRVTQETVQQTAQRMQAPTDSTDMDAATLMRHREQQRAAAGVPAHDADTGEVFDDEIPF